MDNIQKREQAAVASAFKAASGYNTEAIKAILKKKAEKLRTKYRNKYGIEFDARVKPTKKTKLPRNHVAQHMNGVNRGGAHQVKNGKKMKRSKSKANWKRDL